MFNHWVSLLLAILIVFCILGMIYTRVVLYAIYYLVLIFILASILLIYSGITFIGLIYLLLYLGSIIILFIITAYIVGSQMIDDYEKQPINGTSTLFIIFLFFSLILILLLDSKRYVFKKPSTTSLYEFMQEYVDKVYENFKLLDAIAFLLFDVYPIALFLGSFILIIAMMGAIILTLSYHKKKI